MSKGTTSAKRVQGRRRGPRRRRKQLRPNRPTPTPPTARVRLRAVRSSVFDFTAATAVLIEAKPSFLIDNMLFPASPFSLFGLPGVGKSLLALLLAACIVARKPFLGRAINLQHPVSVVYVAAEGKRFIGSRLRAICAEHGIARDDLAHLHILRRPVAVTDLHEVEEFINALVRLVLDGPPLALIFFDTLTKCLGRSGANENDPRDMAMLADRIDHIIERTGAAVGVVDHTGWKTRHERGHSNKRANVETAMLLTRTGANVRLESEKANHSEAFGAINLQIKASHDAAVITLPELGSFAPSRTAAPALMESDIKALRALTSDEEGVAFTRWVNLSGLARATLDRARVRLLNAGFVEKVGPDTKPRYSLTTAGWQHDATHGEPEQA